VPDYLPGLPDSATLTVFNLFRAVGGLGVGLCSIASPMYIAEVAPPGTRIEDGCVFGVMRGRGRVAEWGISARWPASAQGC